MRIFFAGSLTVLKDPRATKAFYKEMARVAERSGHTYFWAFLHGTDPIENPDVPPVDVYKQDIAALDKSDMMVAYLGEPSTGTGIEIEHAHKTGKHIVILYEKGKHVSRMLRGCPGIVKEIVFSSEADALKQLEDYFRSLR